MIGDLGKRTFPVSSTVESVNEVVDRIANTRSTTKSSMTEPVETPEAINYTERSCEPTTTMANSRSSPDRIIRFEEAIAWPLTNAHEMEETDNIMNVRQEPEHRASISDINSRVTEEFVEEIPPKRYRAAVANKAPDLTEAQGRPGSSMPSASGSSPEHTKNPQARKSFSEQRALDLFRFQSTTPAISDYRVGWICALPFEAAAAEVMLDEQFPDLPYDPRYSALYTLGRIGSHKVVVACLPAGRPGTSAATAVAKGMLEKFRAA